MRRTLLVILTADDQAAAIAQLVSDGDEAHLRQVLEAYGGPR